MHVVDIALLGQKGAGKTQFARRLLQITPRAIVWDQIDDYTNGAILHSLAEARDFLSHNRGRDFHLIYRDSFNDKANLALMEIAYGMQQHESLPPIGLFFEEASFYSSSHSVPDIIDRISTKGRHFKINVLNITQRDTQINPILRANAGYIVSMRQKKLSSDMRDIFTTEELSIIQNLQPLTPRDKPQYGVHYITDPPEADIFRIWARSVTGRTGSDLPIDGPLPIL